MNTMAPRQQILSKRVAAIFRRTPSLMLCPETVRQVLVTTLANIVAEETAAADSLNGLI